MAAIFLGYQPTEVIRRTESTTLCGVGALRTRPSAGRRWLRVRAGEPSALFLSRLGPLAVAGE